MRLSSALAEFADAQKTRETVNRTLIAGRKSTSSQPVKLPLRARWAPKDCRHWELFGHPGARSFIASGYARRPSLLGAAFPPGGISCRSKSRVRRCSVPRSGRATFRARRSSPHKGAQNSSVDRIYEVADAVRARQRKWHRHSRNRRLNSVQSQTRTFHPGPRFPARLFCRAAGGPKNSSPVAPGLVTQSVGFGVDSGSFTPALRSQLDLPNLPRQRAGRKVGIDQGHVQRRVTEQLFEREDVSALLY